MLIKRSLCNFIVSIILISFNSCQIYRYSKNSFVPVFTKTGDLTVNANIANQQIGIAVTDNIGVFATNIWNHYRNPYIHTGEGGSSTYHESRWYSLGLIPYFKKNENTYIQFPISLGKGKQTSSYYTPNPDVTFNPYYKLSSNFLTIQPTISYLINNKYCLSFFSHSYLSGNKVIDYKYNPDLLRNSIFEQAYYHPTFFYFVNDIGTNLKFNVNKIDFYFELSYLLYSNPKDFSYNTKRYIYKTDRMEYELLKFNTQLGVTYNFNLMNVKLVKKKRAIN